MSDFMTRDLDGILKHLKERLEETMFGHKPTDPRAAIDGLHRDVCDLIERYSKPDENQSYSIIVEVYAEKPERALELFKRAAVALQEGSYAMTSDLDDGRFHMARGPVISGMGKSFSPGWDEVIPKAKP